MRIEVDDYLEEEGLPQCQSCGSSVMAFEWEIERVRCQECGELEEDYLVKKKDFRLPPKEIKRFNWDDE